MDKIINKENQLCHRCKSDYGCIYVEYAGALLCSKCSIKFKIIISKFMENKNFNYRETKEI
jgi:hypothetical protein